MCMYKNQNKPLNIQVSTEMISKLGQNRLFTQFEEI